jgi:glycine cleavage system H protein
MVALFMVAMILTFLIVDYFVQKRSATEPATANTIVHQMDVSDFFLPQGIFASNNHLKAQLTEDGTLKLGLDNFVFNALGQIDEIILPDTDQQINKGDTLLTVRQGDHKTEIKAFAAGQVSNVNMAYAKNAKYLDESNITKSWAVEFAPENLSASLKMLKVGQDAKEWIQNEVSRFREFLNTVTATPETVPVMQDGGVPAFGVMQNMDNDTWEKFEKEFLS